MNKIGVVAFPFVLSLQQKKILKKKLKVTFKYLDPNKKKNNKCLRYFLKDCSGVIAGTEKYNKELLASLNNLKAIFRVGIGIDNIDLNYAKKKNIKVFNTPDAPSISAAEYAVALILDSIKGCTFLNNLTKKNIWKRYEHNEFSNTSIGIIGLGRIGSRVLNLLLKFPFKNIYANDIDKKKLIKKNRKIIYCSKNYLLKRSDILTLHVPLTNKTKNFINKNTLSKLKFGSCIVNTSRGEVINEKDLLLFLKKNYFGSVMLDVMQQEPYSGPLLKFENCIITPHNASMSKESRNKMVVGTIENIKKIYQKAYAQSN
jgi:D-3-phosphoglycerate dehydrogenase / 2-oxoglutarate reductase